MCTPTIDIDLSHLKVAAKDIVWLDDHTFILPDGRKFQMIEEDGEIRDDYTMTACDLCVLNIPDNRNICRLDTDPAFDTLACWGQSEINSQSQTFYYFKLLVD